MTLDLVAVLNVTEIPVVLTWNITKFLNKLPRHNIKTT